MTTSCLLSEKGKKENKGTTTCERERQNTSSMSFSLSPPFVLWFGWAMSMASLLSGFLILTCSWISRRSWTLDPFHGGMGVWQQVPFPGYPNSWHDLHVKRGFATLLWSPVPGWRSLLLWCTRGNYGLKNNN